MSQFAPFSESFVMESFGCPKVQVINYKISPLNSRQWNCSLSCGHDFWVTATRKPTKKTAYCTKCGDKVIDAAAQ
jgi:hypothetical protein